MQCYQRKTIRASKIFKSFPKKDNYSQTNQNHGTLSMLGNCTECNVISAQSIINLSPMSDFFIEVRHFTPRCISDERSLICIKGSDNYNYHVFMPVSSTGGIACSLYCLFYKKCIYLHLKLDWYMYFYCRTYIMLK